MHRPFAAALALAILSGPAFATCKEEVAAAFEKQRNTGKFRMVTNMSNEQGPIEMTIDYILPDKMRQTVKTALTQATVETTLISDKAWTNQGAGWSAVPPEFVDELTNQMTETVMKPPSVFIDYACLGKVAVDGKEYFTYRAQEDKSKPIPGAPQANPPVRMVYVDPETGLPARNVVAVESRIEKPFFKTVYTYPAEMTIEPPEAAPPNPAP